MPDLCQLADVKAWLSIGSGTTTDDALLTRLITATSADFLSEIDRYDFMAADYTEVRLGKGLRGILQSPEPEPPLRRKTMARHWPLNSIASFTLDGAAITASADGIASGYWFDPNTDPENRSVVMLIGYAFTRWSTLTWQFNAGYTTVPTDVTQAVIEWIAARYRGRQGAGIGSLHITEGRSQAEGVAYTPWDMPQATSRIAQRYKTNALALMFEDD